MGVRRDDHLWQDGKADARSHKSGSDVHFIDLFGDDGRETGSLEESDEFVVEAWGEFAFVEDELFFAKGFEIDFLQGGQAMIAR